MFDPAFLDTLADMVAQKVIDRLERNTADKSGLSKWLELYGPVMTRDEVAMVLKVSKRHVQNLESAGKVRRTDVPGKQVKYETAHIFAVVNSNTSITTP